MTLVEPGRNFPGELLEQIAGDLDHRGPDSAGFHRSEGCAMVFRRLAILDPRAVSDQPMSDPESGLTLAFNGEIYNYRRLRLELESLGARFTTGGDTEVLLQGWKYWGEGVLDRIEGMYAFTVLDPSRRVLCAARDPLAIKPLYLLRHRQLVALASEMRPLRRIVRLRPDPAALAELLVFRFAASPLGNLENIERVPGGTLLRIPLDGGAITRRSFSDPLETLRAEPEIGPSEAEEMVHEALVQSVADHLQSDVGYSIQLSGGVDSSLITAIAAGMAEERVRTYSVRITDRRHDEGRWRRLVIDRYPVEHHEVTISGEDYAEALPDAVRHMEGPIAHSGCPMLMLLCRRIREYSPVTLTGEGADELFGGYMKYRLWRALRRKGRLARLVPGFLWPVLQRYREIQRYAGGRDPAIYASVFGDFLSLHALFPDLVPGPGSRERAASRFSDFRERLFAVDQTAYLESHLLRQDKLSMAASVEARVPFCHLPLLRVVNRLPLPVRLGSDETKPLLKRIASRYLPPELIHRRKVGLTLPLLDWLADPQGLGRYLELLTAPDCRLAGWCEHALLRRAVERFRGGERTGLPPLEHLITVELWLRDLETPPAGSAASPQQVRRSRAAEAPAP